MTVDFVRKLLKSKHLKRGLYYIFRVFPIKENVVFFESHKGLSYSCNPKYLHKYLSSNCGNLKFVWSLVDVNVPIEADVVKVRRFSIRYYWYMARAKYWVNNAEFAQGLPKRAGQKYLNTQHGTPFKKMGKHKLVDFPERVPKTGRWDALVSASPYVSKIFSEAYMYGGLVLESGTPRNDVLLNPETDAVGIKKKLGLPVDKHLVLYAPTWREGSGIDIDMKALLDKLGDDYAILLRLHHLVDKSIAGIEKIQGLHDVSSGLIDIQELLLVADVLLSDYSSVIFDYSLLRKPMVYFMYDLDEYRDLERGLYFDPLAVLPGKVVLRESELSGALLNAQTDFNKNKNKYEDFVEVYSKFEHGNACEQIADNFFGIPQVVR
ncbi:CDP-glycerol glycerophosphotransferase family protein [Pseudomaricurvus sp. HS19]|uniref:CDP-glycerol glycerophosphotransferase family protein n=1 Tax=Pseudomaricurvus sp. HS19 TaxID=2692626 RepID=UPI00136D1A17|nr:CDP-glycerol glycerophosphotransferase family protein [Pseudomaricurvus sp. HS19]MYM64708.1 hypothetical protein [Pseudomaricurvus sp. HS19]